MSDGGSQGKGALALVGAGEFLESMRPVDRALLARSPGKRVVILPTASAPDGPGVAEGWVALGVKHFQALGAQVEGVLALNRQDCARPSLVEAVDQADLLYFSGGKPDYLVRTLRGTPLLGAVLRSLDRGGTVVGCSAGAMIWGGWVPGRPRLGQAGLWQPALAALPRAVIAPHFDELPRWALGLFFRLRPRGSYLLGVDRATALVGLDGRWLVLGSGRVVVRGGGPIQVRRGGEAVALPPGPAGREPER